MNRFKIIRKKLFKRLTYKYRFKITNESTFEELASFRLSRMNVFVAGGIVSLFLIFITTMVIAYTPLREYIPGYADVNIRKQALELSKRTDSLETAMQEKDLFLFNIKAIIDGKPTVRSLQAMKDSSRNYSQVDDSKSPEDSTLRRELYEERKFRVEKTSGQNKLFFFSPVRGQILDKANIPLGKYGIRIRQNGEDPVKSVSDGVILYDGWSPYDGYFMIIVHPNRFISIYRNNAALLHKAGDVVQAGEAIAQGKPDEHGQRILYFELWHNNGPTDPENHITF